jgi:hypothetical protein
VPATPLTAAAWKELCEFGIVTATGAVVAGLGEKIKFTIAGLSFEEFESFFIEALAAAKKVEPIVEAGNRYSVDTSFGRLNGSLLLHDIKHDMVYKALSNADKTRAGHFFEMMCLNSELRNRNPLHPNPLDSVVIGNLLNFPKHVGYVDNVNCSSTQI